MLYPVPSNVTQIAWNGTNLYYIINKEGSKIVKCAGETKRADFGRELSSVNYAFDGQAKIAANNSHIFCVDDNDFHVFDENINLKQKIFISFKTIISISCSEDGSVTILSDKNTIYCFTLCP